jgi:hypothetical protein
MMPVGGIGNVVQILADQLSGQVPGAPEGANTPGPSNAGNPVVTEDSFTLSKEANSTQAAAQEAGIFQVSPGALSAVTAGILFAQTAPNAAQNGLPAQTAPGTVTAPGNVELFPAANSETPANPGQLFAAKPAGQAPPPEAAPTTNVQEKIQALNASLPALGLSKVEIREIDDLASQIQNFNPAAYTNVVEQFEAEAQQATQQNAENAAANAGKEIGAARASLRDFAAP